jgi:carbonic anhydrase
VVGQLRTELFGLGAAKDLEEACRLHALNAARNLLDSIVLLTDRLREGRLQVEAASCNLYTLRIASWAPCCPTASPASRGAGLVCRPAWSQRRDAFFVLV